jgi:hypothetical protein
MSLKIKLKGTVSKHFNQYCVCADGLQGLSKSFHIARPFLIRASILLFSITQCLCLYCRRNLSLWGKAKRGGIEARWGSSTILILSAFFSCSWPFLRRERCVQNRRNCAMRLQEPILHKVLNPFPPCPEYSSVTCRRRVQGTITAVFLVTTVLYRTTTFLCSTWAIHQSIFVFLCRSASVHKRYWFMIYEAQTSIMPACSIYFLSISYTGLVAMTSFLQGSQVQNHTT